MTKRLLLALALAACGDNLDPEPCPDAAPVELEPDAYEPPPPVSCDECGPAGAACVEGEWRCNVAGAVIYCTSDDPCTPAP